MSKSFTFDGLLKSILEILKKDQIENPNYILLLELEGFDPLMSVSAFKSKVLHKCRTLEVFQQIKSILIDVLTTNIIYRESIILTSILNIISTFLGSQIVIYDSKDNIYKKSSSAMLENKRQKPVQLQLTDTGIQPFTSFNKKRSSDKISGHLSIKSSPVTKSSKINKPQNTPDNSVNGDFDKLLANISDSKGTPKPETKTSIKSVNLSDSDDDDEEDEDVNELLGDTADIITSESEDESNHQSSSNRINACKLSAIPIKSEFNIHAEFNALSHCKERVEQTSENLGNLFDNINAWLAKIDKHLTQPLRDCEGCPVHCPIAIRRSLKAPNGKPIKIKKTNAQSCKKKKKPDYIHLHSLQA
jgi:hypothetical protein